jgi:Siphovirus Gp157
MSVHDSLKKLKEIRYGVEPEDLDGLSDGLVESADFQTLCLEIAESAVEHELQAKAVADRITEMSERKARLVRTAETLRSVVLQAMEIRGQSSIPSPTLTLSVTRRGGDLVVTDEALIPTRFFKQPSPVLDKKALKETVVADGEIIEGATIGNGSISLTIRRK